MPWPPNIERYKIVNSHFFAQVGKVTSEQAIKHEQVRVLLRKSYTAGHVRHCVRWAHEHALKSNPRWQPD